MAKTEKDVPCHVERASEAIPGHIHDCIGNHPDNPNNHFCKACGRHWGKRSE